MKTTSLTLLLLAASLAGCATSSTGGDAVQRQNMAELKQGWQDGSFPVTEKQFVYPNWLAAAAPQPPVAP